jgi:hypothetical protein
MIMDEVEIKQTAQQAIENLTMAISFIEMAEVQLDKIRASQDSQFLSPISTKLRSILVKVWRKYDPEDFENETGEIA